MPIYQYHCDKCGHQFDALKRMSEREPTGTESCPDCDEIGSIRLGICAPNFVYSAAKMPKNTKLQEKLQQIHENTYGSSLNTTSTITKI